MATSKKGTTVKGEHFTLKSKTNSIQYISTGQAVQNMLTVGIEKNIMAVNNSMGANDIDIDEINAEGLNVNEYRNDKFDTIDNGRRANQKIEAEIMDSRKRERKIRDNSTKEEN